MHTGLWLGNLKEGDHLEDWRRLEDNIKMDPREARRGHGLDRSGSG